MKKYFWRNVFFSSVVFALFAGAAEPCVRVAQAQWEPMKGTAAVAPATVAGRPALRLPCTFAGTSIERASWDVPAKLDLSTETGLRFDMFCRDTAPIAHFSLYLRSGAGWYHVNFFPEFTNAWCSIAINKEEARAEGTPAGWDKIDLLRFSAWRGKDTDAEFFLGDIFTAEEAGGKPLVAVVRADSAIQRSDESKSVQQFADGMAKELRAAGVNCTLLGDGELNAKTLAPFQLLVLPYNPGMPDAVADEIVQFAERGGKVLAFYNVSSKLQSLLGIKGGQHVKETKPGLFSTIAFAGGALPGAPENVGQKSWNISAFKPATDACRILADWRDEAGQPTGYAAVLGTSNTLVMTHVLLTDDPANKRRMLLAMVTRLAPETGGRLAAAALAGIGKDFPRKSFEEVIGEIQKLGSAEQRTAPAVAAARAARDAAEQALKGTRFLDVPELAATADKRLLEAWCTVQPQTPARFRAFWCHDAFGVAGITWDEAIRRLAANGFTAIFPNMLWGGVAFFDSKVLPVATKAKEQGDQIAACLAACQKYGVQIHVWKVNWNLGHAVPDEFVEKMRKEKRLQAGPDGAEEKWLCPSHPANQQLEISAMLEVARNYPVDGIHFDYIRYPDNQHCFCAGCRERFEQVLGAQVTNWPADVRAEGKLAKRWQDWRRSNITTVVKAVSEQARAIRPGIKLSAAVFRNWGTDRDSVGQDWKLWCDNGWLDFVCPMDYTPNNQRFEGMVAQQIEWAGRVPVYPGIGVSASSSHFGAARTIEQIGIACRHHTGGFIIFNYGPKESAELLPQLGLGITRPEAQRKP